MINHIIYVTDCNIKNYFLYVKPTFIDISAKKSLFYLVYIISLRLFFVKSLLLRVANVVIHLNNS